MNNKQTKEQGIMRSKGSDPLLTYYRVPAEQGNQHGNNNKQAVVLDSNFHFD
jgi:hypothetical protein